MAGGRPTKYTPKILKKTEEYLNGGYEDAGHVVPSQSGLSEYIDIALSTIKKWASEDGKEEFSAMLDKIERKQHNLLFSAGLTGDFNAAITKLMLTKHGYSDKQTLSGDSENPLIPSEMKIIHE